MNIGSLEVMLGANTAGLSRAAVNMRRFESQVLNSNMSMQASFRALGSQMMLTGTLLTQYLTVPLALLSGAAVTTFSSFEAELGKIVSLTDFSSQQVKKMAGEILDMAGKVGKSPKELAKGLYFIGSSGIKDETLAMDLLTKSANASRIGLGETKVVADALTSVLNAYGQSAISAGQATDILVAAVRVGKGEADQLARVIGHVMPLAVQLGVGFDEVAGSLAGLTLTGKSASEASTQIARLFTTLIQSPPEAEKALEKMGISFASLRKDLRDDGMLKMLQSLKKMVGGNTLSVLENSKAYEQNISVLGDVFTNIRALLPVLDMLGPNFKNIQDVFGATANAAGSLTKGLEGVQNTVKDKWNRTMAGMQSSLVKFGAVLQGPIIAMIQKFGEFISRLADNFARLPKEQQATIIKFTALGIVLGPLLIILGQVVGAVRTLFMLFGGATIMTTVGLFVALGAAIYYTYKNWDLFVQAIQNFSFKSLWEDVNIWLNETIGFGANIQKQVDKWDTYANSVKGAGELQKQVIEKQKEYNALMEDLSKANPDSNFLETYSKIKTTLTEITDLREKIFKMGSPSGSGSSKALGALQPGPEPMQDWITGMSKSMLLKADKLKKDLQEKLDPNKVGFGDFFSKAFDDITSDVSEGFNKLQKMVTGVDLGKLSGGFGLGDTTKEVEKMSQAMDLWKIQKAAMLAIEMPTINTDPLKPVMDAYSRFTDIVKGTDAALAINANLAATLGPNYDRAAKDVSILNDALDELTAPEMVKTMTPDQLTVVREYLALLNQIQDATKGNSRELSAWKGLLSSIGTLMNSVSKYMSESFQKTFSIIVDMVNIASQLVNVIDKVGKVIKAMAAAESVANAAKAAAIPVTLAAAAAEGVKAAASTDAAIAGAAASTSWIPIVGVGLAIAGIAALVMALSKSKSKATGMATGGMVPSGFPNDSFPAMLTSGETVIPLNKVSEMFGNGQSSKKQKQPQVVFKIGRKELIGFLDLAAVTGRSF